MMAIVYKSPAGLRTALDFYLADKTPGFKAVYRTGPHDRKYLSLVLQQDGQMSNTRPEDKLLPYLQLLHKFARQLRSTVELEYSILDPLETLLVPAMTAEQDARYAKLGESSWEATIYLCWLKMKGGNYGSILEDFDQAKRIVRLITKVDSLIQRSSDDIKHVVRRNREDLIATLPPRRVWLSIKHLRRIVEQDHTNSQTMSFENVEGKEDVIVDGKPGTLSISMSSC